MLANQIFQPVHSFRFGNIEFYCRFADVKIHLARRAANVTKIGVRHFPGSVHDAAHDRDLYPFEMRCGVFDFGRRGLQVEQGASAAADALQFKTSFNKIGCRECNLPASNRKAGITARSTSSLTVTNCGLRSAFNLAIAVSSRGSISTMPAFS